MSEPYSWLLAAALFGAGIAESLLMGWNTNAVARHHRAGSFWSDFIHVIVAILALKSILENVNTFVSLLAYATGSGFGSLFAVMIAQKYKHRRKRLPVKTKEKVTPKEPDKKIAEEKPKAPKVEKLPDATTVVQTNNPTSPAA